MAEVVRYVNTDSTAGGDGTTNLTTGATRAYASLAEWETDEDTDLVAAEDNHVVYCSAPSGVLDESPHIVVGGWTTNATYDVLIKGDNPAPAATTTNKYTLDWPQQDNGYNGVLFYNATGHISIEDCLILYDELTYVQGAGIGTYYDGCRVEGCTVRESTGTRMTGANSAGIFTVGSNGVVVNCVFTGCTLGTRLAGSGAQIVSYNTAYDCGTGFFAGFSGMGETDSEFNNNLGIDNATDFNINKNGSPAGTEDYNASSDATADDTNSVANVSVTFVDAANFDFHLAAGDTDVIGVGVPMHTNPDYAISTDAEGDTRDTSTPDIGADEYLAVAVTLNQKRISAMHFLRPWEPTAMADS